MRKGYRFEDSRADKSRLFFGFFFFSYEDTTIIFFLIYTRLKFLNITAILISIVNIAMYLYFILRLRYRLLYFPIDPSLVFLRIFLLFSFFQRRLLIKNAICPLTDTRVSRFHIVANVYTNVNRIMDNRFSYVRRN